MTTHIILNKNELEPPWYKQFWPWFLIALPGSVVVAGFATLYIAFSGSDSLVTDDYYKKGLAVNQSIEKVQLARQMGITASITLQSPPNDTQNLFANIALTGNYGQADNVLVKFAHPTQKGKDFDLNLGTDKLNHTVAVPHYLVGKWHMTMVSEGQDWLLSETIYLSVNQVTQIK